MYVHVCTHIYIYPKRSKYYLFNAGTLKVGIALDFFPKQCTL